MDDRDTDSGEARNGSSSLPATSYWATLGANERQKVPTVISFGPFTLYPCARVLERDGARLALGSRALDILIVLTEHAGEVVGQKELIRRVWRGLVVTPSNLRVHIAGLRRVLREEVGSSQYIANVPGQGYCFVAPISRPEFKELSRAAPEPPEPATPLSDPSLNSAKREAPVADVIPTVAGLRLSWEKRNRPSQLMSFVRCENDTQLLNLLLAVERLLTQRGLVEAVEAWLAMQVNAQTLGCIAAGSSLDELASLGDTMPVVERAADLLRRKAKRRSPLTAGRSADTGTKCLFLVVGSDDRWRGSRSSGPTPLASKVRSLSKTRVAYASGAPLDTLGAI
jgi:DNA-binding winged helix-turn-helix (wHTH) protein